MKALVMTALLSLSASSAFAAQTLDFDQLKDACQNPAKYHNQVQPTGIKIDCADQQTSWIQDADDSRVLPAARVIGHAVSSDKYSVPMTNESVDLPSTNASCPVFKQVQETVSSSQTFTCDQLLAFQGTATELCKGVLDQVRGENPQAIARKETGEVVHLCQATHGIPSDDRGQRGQRGQR